MCARVSLKSGIAKFWAKSESLLLLLYVHSRVRFIYLFIYFLGVGVFVGLNDKINTKIRTTTRNIVSCLFISTFCFCFSLFPLIFEIQEERCDGILFCGVSLPSLSFPLLSLSLVVPPVFLFPLSDIPIHATVLASPLELNRCSLLPTATI